MRAQGFGRIVNIASTAGLKGYPYVTAYVAAKHALVGFTRALALETINDGITVNAVCPGFTDTDMVARVRRHHRRRDGTLAATGTASNSHPATPQDAW